MGCLGFEYCVISAATHEFHSCGHIRTRRGNLLRLLIMEIIAVLPFLLLQLLLRLLRRREPDAGFGSVCINEGLVR